MDLHIRIHREYAEIQQWIVNEDCSFCVVYQHDADQEVSRTHCHIWIKGVKCNTDSLKNHIKKVVGKVPKEDWAFMAIQPKTKTPYNDTLITYMSKGELDPKYIKGWTEEEIEEFRRKWIPPPNPITTQDGKLVVKRVVKETTKKTKRELINEMMETYLPEMELRETLELIRKVLIKNNEVLGMYKVTDFYDSLLCYGNKEKFLDMIEQKINSRIRI